VIKEEADVQRAASFSLAGDVPREH